MPSKYELGYEAGMDKAMQAVIKLLDKLADARRDSAEWKEQHENLLAMFRTSENRAAQAEARAEAMANALAESVKLQSHYASLLNQYDGGNRKGFADAQEWIERLAALSKLDGET